jgi:hypothetical protein
MSAVIASSVSSSENTSFRVYYRHHQTLVALTFRDTRLRA